MVVKPIPTPEEVRNLLRYDAETGRLYWLPRRSKGAEGFNAKWAGAEAFTASRSGYRVGNINQRTFTAHRVIWALVHGVWPSADIDHINGCRSDNRLSNLRSVSRTENLRNLGMSSRNTSGVTGVYRNAHTWKWSAKISVGNRSKHLGYFATRDEAGAARARAEQYYGFSPTHGRRA